MKIYHLATLHQNDCANYFATRFAKLLSLRQISSGTCYDDDSGFWAKLLWGEGRNQLPSRTGNGPKINFKPIFNVSHIRLKGLLTQTMIFVPIIVTSCPAKGNLCTDRIVSNFDTQSGVDVMITIFCDFWQFSAKKLALFSKTNVMIKILHNFALFWVKNANFFAEIFGEKI
jgi:hypothetical protein